MTTNDQRTPSRRPNHLSGQTSPYLLQHLYNPVDWHAWGPKALERARAEDKPIFLSIGYAACHWCHVMERESFENATIAELLNSQFVSIKVDREERPDLDEIYMNAVQLMTGQGGWPLTVFLTPGLAPFMGGTYFPPDNRHGRPGFAELLAAIREAWTSRRGEIERSAEAMTAELQRIARGGALDDAAGTSGEVDHLARAAAELARRFEPRWGGFGQAPKFPPDGALAVLLREHARSGSSEPLGLASKTLDGMALGGIYDHVGGGFARYSTDDAWLVPHFEKMLYNQALLVPAYLEAWLLTGRPLYRRVVEETLDFVHRELTGDGGGFYSSLDADSEGVEGRFYVWTPEEVAEVLDAGDGALFCETYGIERGGNFEGKSIPNLLRQSLAQRAAVAGLEEEELAARLRPLRERLLAARNRRVRPGTDDKVLASWNGLMISACARAYQALGRAEDLRSARRAADFLLSALARGGRLLATWREGRARLNGYLDDYAFVGRGLVDLYEACFEPVYLEQAALLAETLVARFEDPERGGFYFTSDDHETLLTRNRSFHDGALPAGAGVACELLVRLAVHLDRPAFRQTARRALAAARSGLDRLPSAHASPLVAADYDRGPLREVAIVGTPDDAATRELLGVVRRRFDPRLVIQLAADPVPAGLALLTGKRAVGNRPTAWVCRDYACRQPTSDPVELARELAGS